MESTEEVSPKDIHDFATFIADEYQKKSAQVNRDDEWGDIVRSALVSITHESVILHRALGDLCVLGWSSAGAPIFRTMLDLTVSMMAIGHSSCSPLAAFRYFHAGYVSETRNTERSKEWRSGARDFLKARVSMLPNELQSEARNIMNEKDRAYWFQPEFQRPTEIVEKFGTEHFRWLYKVFSSAAHGGFLGLRSFRDDPFELNINPRLPMSYAGAKLMVHSAGLLVDIILLRDSYQRLGYKENEKLVLSYFDKVKFPPER